MVFMASTKVLDLLDIVAGYLEPVPKSPIFRISIRFEREKIQVGQPISLDSSQQN